MSRTRRIAATPLLVTVLGLAGLAGLEGLAGCSSDRSGNATSAVEPAAGVAQGSAAQRDMSQADAAAGGEAAASAPAAAPAPASASRAAVVTASGKAAGGGADLPAPDVRMVKTAQVVVEVTNLRTAAVRVRALAEGAGGTVASETTSFEPTPTPADDQEAATSTAAPSEPATAGPGAPDAAKQAPPPAQPGESVLVLRVPVAAMDRTVDQVAGTAGGREVSRTSSSQDVTADLADLGSRVKTQRSSVDRIRALLAKANSLQDVVLLESELTRRESDLEALEARQASLAGRADLSTLTVTLRTPQVVTRPPAPAKDNAFVAGLKQGWHAVAVSTGVVLTVIGALLPLLVVLAVIGLPLWRSRLRPRFGRRPVTGATASPSGAPSPDAPSPTAAPSPATAPSPDASAADGDV